VFVSTASSGVPMDQAARLVERIDAIARASNIENRELLQTAICGGELRVNDLISGREDGGAEDLQRK